MAGLAVLDAGVYILDMDGAAPARERRTMDSNDFPCSRCEGRGKIGAYSHVLGGVCLKCHGTGRQSCKPRCSAVKYAVFLLNRETGMAERIYNFAARSSAEALRELDRKYFNFAKLLSVILSNAIA